MNDLYITTAIPYVNGAPHLGHALECVHVDALARHRRRRGGRVRVQSGTDDHAIKNVSAAEAACVRVAELVRAKCDRFAALTGVLGLRADEFLRTSSDPRHAACVVAVWEACRAADDLYTKDYTGRYCPGCEQFYTAGELVDGSCAEHRTPLVEVTETNWFFRPSGYRERITDLITSGRLDITPPERRNEVLGFLAGDVHDLSVSRPAARSRGWGIPVPGDPEQVVYVWFDALVNHITGLGHATGDNADYRRWWASGGERVHVIGKGIARFHAVYWIAFLLSAGLPLPSRVPRPRLPGRERCEDLQVGRAGRRPGRARRRARRGRGAVVVAARPGTGRHDRLHDRAARRRVQPGPGQRAGQPRVARTGPVPTRHGLAHRRGHRCR
jgi:methionyl-tRNA synthetase